MTIAVEDMANAAAMVSAEGGARPRRQAKAPRINVVTTTCASPSPKTSRRMRRNRSNESSSPMVNKSATTPNAAMRSIASILVIAKASSQRARAASRPKPYGPSATPASRKPRTGLTLRRKNSGATTPAVARNSKASL